MRDRVYPKIPTAEIDAALRESYGPHLIDTFNRSPLYDSLCRR